MLSRPPRRGAGRRDHAGARALALILLIAASLAATPKDLSPGPSPGRRGEAGTAAAAPARWAGETPALPGTVDAETALQRLAEEAERIDPAAPDAVARLRTVVRALIELERAHRQEIAALRAELNAARVASTSRSSSSAAAKPAAARATGRTSASIGTSSSGPQAADGGLFGKRGLKKVHRPGCPFGERISAETRVHFKSLADANSAGYEPCKSCRPADP